MAMIVNEEGKNDYLKAGKIAGKALLYAAKSIKPGMPIRELLDNAEEKIFSLGGNLGFPAQAALNNIAAHQCPTEEEGLVFNEEDMVKLDFGAEYEGFIGDTATTVYLGNDSEKKKIVEASKKALQEAMKLIKPGTPVNEIGRKIDEVISSYDLNPIRNLSGHGLGLYEIHDAPGIPNYDNGDDTELEEGEMIAVEPFATNGVGKVKNFGQATVFAKMIEKGTRNPFAREALKIIDEFEGLPFSQTLLEKKLGVGKTRIALAELKKLEILNEFPALREVSDGIVSQHEHSFLVGKKTIITTLVDDDE